MAFKFKIEKDWGLKMAALEGDLDFTAGVELAKADTAAKKVREEDQKK